MLQNTKQHKGNIVVKSDVFKSFTLAAHPEQRRGKSIHILSFFTVLKKKKKKES